MLPNIRRILFATDLGPNAAGAFAYAVGVAAATSAEVHVLNVVESLTSDAKLTLMMFVQDEHARENAISKRVEMTKAILAKRHEEFWASMDEDLRKHRDQVVALDVVEGFPAEEILRRATHGGFDLIVLGAHEHSISHSFLGTTAKRVLRRASIPTLIVPRRSHE